jgi:hypothetical protein
MDQVVNIDEKFVMPARLKMWSFVMIAVGVVGVIASFFIYPGDEGTKHIWSTLVLMGVYFQGIVMANAFFQAATYVAYGGWHTVMKRVPEAIGMMLPVTGILLLLILAVPNLIYGYHPVYEWTNKAIVASDPIMQAKVSYLNLPFFFVRFAFFVGILTYLAYLMRKNSLLEDQHEDLKYYKSNLKWASLFLVFFAVYILVMAWDWVMSIDAHWYSTMYGWYTFASNWVNGIAALTLVVLYLKKKGYLTVVNNSHLHDLGLLMFAFSIFWTYVTFCQFMLIWYANIPEETEYFRLRYDHFMWLFYGIFIINFLTPFLLLMSRDAKRKARTLAIAAVIIMIGHFIDYYLMVYPATIGIPKFGLIEISSLLFYIGLFIYVVFTNLGKANLIPKHHPFLQESLHHST